MRATYPADHILLYLVTVRDSSVGIESDYGLDGRGFILGRSKRFSLLHSVQTGSEAHPSSYPMGTGAFSPGIKWRRPEADHTFS
jgi:hypothetical protein